MAYRIQCKQDILSSWSVLVTTNKKSEAVKAVKEMKKAHPSLLLCVVDLSTRDPVISL